MPLRLSWRPKNSCNCTSMQIQKYKNRISGPLLDRIDLHLEVAALNYNEMSSSVRGESSKRIKKRVDNTRAVQKERFAIYHQIYCNAQMNSKLVEKYCKLDRSSSSLLEKSVTRLGLSARAYHRILKIARTIADMVESNAITSAHVAEAVQYRRLDM